MATKSEQTEESAYQLANKSLIFGILSLFGPVVMLVFSLDAYSIFDSNPLLTIGWIAGLLGLPALIIGNQALKRIRANQEKGEGVALIGIILGALGILYDIGWLLIIIMVGTGY